MRPIDAEALEEEIVKTMRYVPKDAVLDVACMVNRAPTISLSYKRYYEAETKELVKIFLENFSGNEKEIEAFCEMLVKNYVVVLLGPKDFGIKGPPGPRGVKTSVISMEDVPITLLDAQTKDLGMAGIIKEMEK